MTAEKKKLEFAGETEDDRIENARRYECMVNLLERIRQAITPTEHATIVDLMNVLLKPQEE